MHEFINLTAELMVGRRGPEVQLDGMHIKVKVEKPENYDGSKQRDLNTWLFQVQEHLNIIVIHMRGHVPYAASLLRGNATLWWHKLCESNNRPMIWNDFCHLLHEQFRPENYSRHGRDELAELR